MKPLKIFLLASMVMLNTAYGETTMPSEAEDNSIKPTVLWHNSTTGAVKFMPINSMIPGNTLNVVDSSNLNLIPRGIGDFTGDGKPDILFHNQNSGNLRIWEMDGAVKVNNILVLGSSNTNLKIAGIGDFDQDGDNDIATFNTNSGALRMWVMEGTTRVDNVLVLTGANTNLVPSSAGDMDGDGIPDLVLRNNNSGAVRVWTMSSDFTRKGNEYVTGSSNTNLELRGVMDINGDGNNDILNYNTNTGKLRAWLMDGYLNITENAEIIQESDLKWSVRGGGDLKQSIIISAIVISPKSALLTKSGQTAQLTPTVYDAAGNKISVKLDWSSSHPKTISVDNNGTITSLAGVGSALITASYGKTVSNKAMVLIASPVPGAVLVSDDQVVGDILPEDPDVPWGVGMQFKTRLSGVVPPKEGSIILGTGDKPFGGQVVSVTQVGNDVEVVVETVTMEEMFTELIINEQIDLSHEVPILAQAFADNYEVNWQSGGNLEFTLQEKVLRSAALPARVGVPMGTSVLNANANHGPFTCTSDFTNPLVLDGFPTNITVTNNLWVDAHIDLAQGGLQHLLLRGDVQGAFKVANTLSAALQGKVSCKATFALIPFPIGQVVFLYVPLGIGFDLDGKITLAQVGFEVDAKAKADIVAGLQCSGGSCDMVGNLDTNSSAKFRWITPDFTSPLEILAQLRIEPSLTGYVHSGIQVGAPPPIPIRAELLKFQAGLKQAGNFAIVEGQMDDERYRSNYLLSFDSSVGAGKTINSVAGFLQVNIAQIGLKWTTPLAESPKVLKAVADTLAFQPGDKVNFTIDLDPRHINYPIIGYNVSKVLIYRRTKDHLGDVGPADLLAEVVPTQGQTQVAIEWTADVNGTIEGDYFAFVETEALPFPYFGELEVAEITVDQECVYRKHVGSHLTTYERVCGDESIAHNIWTDDPVNETIELATDCFAYAAKYTLWLNHTTMDFSNIICAERGTGWVVMKAGELEHFEWSTVNWNFPQYYIDASGGGIYCWSGPSVGDCPGYTCPPIDSIQPLDPFPGDCHVWWDHFNENGIWKECDY